MNAQLIITFFIAIHLRKSLQTATRLPEWNNILIWIIIACILLQVSEFALPAIKPVTKWMSLIMVFGILGIIYLKEEFRTARSSMVAVLPVILVASLEDLSKSINISIYDGLNGLFKTAWLFSIIWLITMFFVNKKQKKALDKERIKTQEEERQNKIMAVMKAELEVQVAERTAALTGQKEELEQALTDLKSTQAQLIQSEKLASLGELTAGIAHEIQNPLNFVNNFAEVNAELIEELKMEIDRGNVNEAKALANDIKENETKINYHGKRADAIVKGMLMHSRSSSGIKEPTDINALADEYLRLAYHGLRAKDKSFNATMKTNFDDRIGNIKIIPQDIGRVMLNLITNAFYAVTEKKRKRSLPFPEIAGTNSGGTGNPQNDYEPTITVTTSLIPISEGGGVLISVKDNGDGIPQKVLDKVFQPFFTTKPTGQGTGLGLSLGYDIVKAHGGEIKVKTKEGEGTNFTILLPNQ
ncbi:MAG: ATP-binding protein [Ferruginibacter sp.]